MKKGGFYVGDRWLILEANNHQTEGCQGHCVVKCEMTEAT